MTAQSERVTAQLHELLGCAYDALDPKPGRSFVAPGSTVAWDNCCEGSGQLWTRLVQMTPAPVTSQSQRLTASGTPCGVLMWNVDMEVGVLRCAHTVDSRGNPPTQDELTSDGEQTVADMGALLEAIQCCYAPTFDRMDQVVIRQWTPLGPEGGCTGGAWSLSIRMLNCGCP